MAKTNSAKLLRIFLSLILLTAFLPYTAFADDEVDQIGDEERPSFSVDDTESFIEGELIVVYNESVSEERAQSLINTRSSSTLSQLSESQEIISVDEAEGTTIARVELEDDVSVEEAIGQFMEDPRVKHAQPNFVYNLLNEGLTVEEGEQSPQVQNSNSESITPILDESLSYEILGYTPLTTSVTDPFAAISTDIDGVNQWWLHSVNAFDAWDKAQCNSSVTIAIIDTGINFEHSDLRSIINTEHAYDAVNREPLTTSPTIEDLGHGTHVAGIAGAEVNNAFQFAGASYNANILPLNVFYYSSDHKEYVADTETLVHAYQYLSGLMNQGELDDLHVINMSLGGYGEYNQLDEVFRQEIAAMNERGVMTVCAGGNGDKDRNPITDPSYPSDFEECVAVVPLQSNNIRPNWADYNDNKDISAPGVRIWSTWIKGSDAAAQLQGSSMASPLVAGCAALLWAREPSLSVDDAKGLLYSTADDLGEKGFDPYYGWGKVNISAAIDSMRGAAIITGDKPLYRTQSIELEAELYTNLPDDPATGTSWLWSVDKPEVATVSDEGVLTGLTEGKVTVTVQAAKDSSVIGTKKISIHPIVIPDGITVSAGTEYLDISWAEAPAATSYELYRAKNTSDTWELYSRVSATEATEGSLSFRDRNVDVYTPYYYKVIPHGTLNVEDVVGKESNVAASLCKSPVTELEGTDRYKTMGAILDLFLAEKALDESALSTIIIANGDMFPDALAASSLAGLNGAPIILTHAKELTEEGVSLIKSIKPQNIIVVGGEPSVSTGVINTIKSLAPQAKVDIVAGRHRVETACQIYDKGKGDWGNTAVVATSATFADALSISPYTYAAAAPIFLVDPNPSKGLSPEVSQRIKDGAFSEVIIVGSEVSVPAIVETQLASYGIQSVRWAGDNRYATSQIIAQNIIDSGIIEADEIGIATGEGFADALSASSLLGLQHNPLILMTDSKGGLAASEGFLAEQKGSSERLTFFGGLPSLSQHVRDSAKEAVGL